MASSYIDKTNMAAVIGTTFDGQTVRPLRADYVFDAFCMEREWKRSSNPKQGDVIQFPVLSAWNANTSALVPTVTTISGSQTLSYTRRTVSLSPYGDHAVFDTFESSNETFVDDVADTVFSVNDQAFNSVNKLAKAAMELNKYSNEVSGGLASTYHRYGSFGAGASTAGPLKAKDVRTVVSLLRARNVKPFTNGYYMCIYHPQQYTQLRADSDDAAWSKSVEGVDTGRGLIQRGQVDLFEGVMFMENSDAIGSGTNTLGAQFFGQEFCGKGIGRDLFIGTKGNMVGPQDNLLVFHWNVLLGYKVIRRESGILVETSATNL
jgi:N4-gp56 family major capsid protein